MCLVLMQQVQVFVDRALTEPRLEIGCRFVALELAVVIQPVWTKLILITIEIQPALAIAVA